MCSKHFLHIRACVSACMCATHKYIVRKKKCDDFLCVHVRAPCGGVCVCVCVYVCVYVYICVVYIYVLNFARHRLA